MFLSYFIVKLRYEIWHKLKVGTYMINDSTTQSSREAATKLVKQENDWDARRMKRSLIFREFSNKESSCKQRCMCISTIPDQTFESLNTKE